MQSLNTHTTVRPTRRDRDITILEILTYLSQELIQPADNKNQLGYRLFEQS